MNRKPNNVVTREISHWRIKSKEAKERYTESYHDIPPYLNEESENDVRGFFYYTLEYLDKKTIVEILLRNETTKEPIDFQVNEMVKIRGYFDALFLPVIIESIPLSKSWITKTLIQKRLRQLSWYAVKPSEKGRNLLSNRETKFRRFVRDNMFQLFPYCFEKANNPNLQIRFVLLRIEQIPPNLYIKTIGKKEEYIGQIELMRREHTFEMEKIVADISPRQEASEEDDETSEEDDEAIEEDDVVEEVGYEREGVEYDLYVELAIRNREDCHIRNRPYWETQKNIAKSTYEKLIYPSDMPRYLIAMRAPPEIEFFYYILQLLSLSGLISIKTYESNAKQPYQFKVNHENGGCKGILNYIFLNTLVKGMSTITKIRTWKSHFLKFRIQSLGWICVRNKKLDDYKQNKKESASFLYPGCFEEEGLTFFYDPIKCASSDIKVYLHSEEYNHRLLTAHNECATQEFMLPHLPPNDLDIEGGIPNEVSIEPVWENMLPHLPDGALMTDRGVLDLEGSRDYLHKMSLDHNAAHLQQREYREPTLRELYPADFEPVVFYTPQYHPNPRETMHVRDYTSWFSTPQPLNMMYPHDVDMDVDDGSGDERYDLT